MQLFVDFSEQASPIEAVFRLANLYVVPFWVLMIFFPRTKIARKVLKGTWFLIPIAFFYALYVIPVLPNLLPVLMAPKLSAIQELSASPEGAALGWLHFLAFDLFVGRHFYWEASRSGWNVFLAGFLLFLILMVGPLGWLAAYTAGRLLPEKTSND